MTTTHRLASLALVGGIGAEFFLAGAGAFGAMGFHAHRILGGALLAVGVVVLIAAVLARRHPRLAATLVVLLAAQFLFGRLGANHPWVGAIHGLTAAAVGAVAAINARRVLLR